MHAAAAFAVYALVTALLFRDLLPVAATHLYSDLGDPLLNAAILAWNAQQLPLTDAWWNFPSYAPLSGVTAFTEHLLLFYPLTTPIVWLTGNAVLAYNAALMICFPLNGLAACWLARELTGSWRAAFIGGLAFAFAPYHSVHLSHIQTLAAFGMPMALLGLHRYIGPAEAGRYGGPAEAEPGVDAAKGGPSDTAHAAAGFSRPGLLIFGLGWLITALSSAYLLLFFPVLVALWCAWFIRPREWRRLVPLLVTAVLFALPLVPVLLGYRERQEAYGLSRPYDEIVQFGAEAIGLIGVSHREQLWRALLPTTYEESALFPGLAILVLGALALWRRGARPARYAKPLLWTSAAVAAVAFARLWNGPFGWRLGPVPLPPVTPHIALSVALVLALAGLAKTGRMRDAWARRDPLMFYAAALIVLWLLALGPQPAWSPSRVRALTYGPYALLMPLPGFDSIRVPARLWLPCTLCLAVLAAFGAASITRKARVWIAIAAIVIVAEGWFWDRAAAAPRPMPAGIIPAGAIVLDLPMDEGFWSATPQYRAVLGGYRTINGYSGYEPRHFLPLRHEIADGAVDALNPYRRLADLYVVIRPDERAQVAAWVMDHPGVQLVHEDKTMRVVRLPKMGDAPARVPVPLPRPGSRPFGVR